MLILSPHKNHLGKGKQGRCHSHSSATHTSSHSCTRYCPCAHKISLASCYTKLIHVKYTGSQVALHTIIVYWHLSWHVVIQGRRKQSGQSSHGLTVEFHGKGRHHRSAIVLVR